MTLREELKNNIHIEERFEKFLNPKRNDRGELEIYFPKFFDFQLTSRGGEGEDNYVPVLSVKHEKDSTHFKLTPSFNDWLLKVQPQPHLDHDYLDEEGHATENRTDEDGDGKKRYPSLLQGGGKRFLYGEYFLVTISFN